MLIGGAHLQPLFHLDNLHFIRVLILIWEKGVKEEKLPHLKLSAPREISF